jgi:hypothetical protein
MFAPDLDAVVRAGRPLRDCVGLSCLQASRAAAGVSPPACAFCTGHADGSRALLDVFSEAGHSSVYARFPGYSGRRLLDVVP